MPNGMSEEAQSRGHAVWEGAPCKGALYPIAGLLIPERQSISTFFQSACPVAGSQISRMSFIASLILAALLQG